MVNINIELPDDLHKKLKIICAVNSTSIKDFINKSIETENIKLETKNESKK